MFFECRYKIMTDYLVTIMEHKTVFNDDILLPINCPQSGRAYKAIRYQFTLYINYFRKNTALLYKECLNELIF